MISIYGNEEQTTALMASLCAMQASRDSHTVGRDAKNPHFRSEYATLAAVVEKGLPAVVKAQLSMLFPMRFDPGTGQHYQQCVLIHIKGGYMVCETPLQPTRNDPQGVKSASTYARRMLAEGMLCLAPDDDDDGHAASQRPDPRGQQRTAPRAPQSSVRDHKAALAKSRRPVGRHEEPAASAPSREMTEEMWRLHYSVPFVEAKQKLGEELYFTIVPEEGVRDIDHANHLLDQLKQVMKQDTVAMKVLAEARGEMPVPEDEYQQVPREQQELTDAQRDQRKPWLKHTEGA